MATLGELKTQITAEVNRDDLADDLATILETYIDRSIEFYANSRFWFNEARTVGTFTIGDEYLNLPAGTRVLDQLYIIIGSVRYEMLRREMDQIETLYSVPMTGQPTDYAIFGDQIRVWPTPNIGWQYIALTVTDVTPLTDDSSSNYWTNEGQDLIDARTRYLLYRDALRDDGGKAAAKEAMDEAYANLKGKTNRKIGVGRLISSW